MVLTIRRNLFNATNSEKNQNNANRINEHPHIQKPNARPIKKRTTPNKRKLIVKLTVDLKRLALHNIITQ